MRTSPDPVPADTGIEGVEPFLLELLACPRCHAPLRPEPPAQELVCTGPACGLAYPVRGGIPVMLVDEARDPRGVRAGSPAGGEA